MYLRKAFELHLPIDIICVSVYPWAAAVEAAPILRL